MKTFILFLAAIAVVAASPLQDPIIHESQRFLPARPFLEPELPTNVEPEAPVVSDKFEPTAELVMLKDGYPNSQESESELPDPDLAVPESDILELIEDMLDKETPENIDEQECMEEDLENTEIPKSADDLEENEGGTVVILPVELESELLDPDLAVPESDTVELIEDIFDKETPENIDEQESMEKEHENTKTSKSADDLEEKKGATAVIHPVELDSELPDPDLAVSESHILELIEDMLDIEAPENIDEQESMEENLENTEMPDSTDNSEENECDTVVNLLEELN